MRLSRSWRGSSLRRSRVSLSTVWRLESGAYPRVEHLIALADVLEVDLDTLVDHNVRGVTAVSPLDQQGGHGPRNV
jgi:transcriptional regulator with XRE-family HTH domain